MRRLAPTARQAADRLPVPVCGYLVDDLQAVLSSHCSPTSARLRLPVRHVRVRRQARPQPGRHRRRARALAQPRRPRRLGQRDRVTSTGTRSRSSKATATGPPEYGRPRGRCAWTTERDRHSQATSPPRGTSTIPRSVSSKFLPHVEQTNSGGGGRTCTALRWAPSSGHSANFTPRA